MLISHHTYFNAHPRYAYSLINVLGHRPLTKQHFVDLPSQTKITNFLDNSHAIFFSRQLLQASIQTGPSKVV